MSVATTKIDSLVREIILENNLPPHKYIQLLSFGLSCLKELDLDLTGDVQSVELPVDEFSRIKLPCDYVDWVRVGTTLGQYVYNLGETSTFNRKLKLEDGVYVPRADAVDEITTAWFDTQWYWGGFRAGGDYRTDEFMLVEKGTVMQLDNSYVVGDTITLDYIYFDKANASTEIHKYAESTIKAWMEWKYISHLPRANPYDKSQAKENYFQQIALLQARKNNLSYEGLMRAKARAFKIL